MNVGPHRLPEPLVALIRAGKWTLPANGRAIEKLTGQRGFVALVTTDAMVRQQQQLLELVETFPTLAESAYGLVDDEDAALPLVYVRALVPFAVAGDDSGIALRYRGTDPDVVCTDPEDGSRWRIVADSFESFWDASSEP